MKLLNSARGLYRRISNAVSSTLLVVGVFVSYVAIDAAILTVLWPMVVPSIFPQAVTQGFIVKAVDFSSMFVACLALVIIRPVNMSTIFSNNKEKKK